jgi:cyclic lactone autoinducer peptide
MNNVISKKCAKMIAMVAGMGAGKVCVGLWHQPRIPKALKTR